MEITGGQRLIAPSRSLTRLILEKRRLCLHFPVSNLFVYSQNKRVLGKKIKSETNTENH